SFELVCGNGPHRNGDATCDVVDLRVCDAPGAARSRGCPPDDGPGDPERIRRDLGPEQSRLHTGRDPGLLDTIHGSGPRCGRARTWRTVTPSRRAAAVALACLTFCTSCVAKRAPEPSATGTPSPRPAPTPSTLAFKVTSSGPGRGRVV